MQKNRALRREQEQKRQQQLPSGHWQVSSWISRMMVHHRSGEAPQLAARRRPRWPKRVEPGRRRNPGEYERQNGIM